MEFNISSKFKPAGDQPAAIKGLVSGLESGMKHQTLLGVTGSGKTFTMANVIQKIQRPTLIIAHNKTLAAQLCSEFRDFFPDNAVEYFVSYYDYYQPEAYLPTTDTYIEKEADINEEIERLRHAATGALLTRRDVIIVASVSCIYGLGSPEFYKKITLFLEKGMERPRDKYIKGLIKMHYDRTEILKKGTFRVKGPIIEIMPSDKDVIYRLELSENDKLKKILEFDALTREKKYEHDSLYIYPAKHFIVPEPIMESAYGKIERELEERLGYLRKHHKLLEAERLERRTRYDLEMMRNIGYCNGIENYSRYLTGRRSGSAPYTLIDYFPKDYLMIIDESHVTVPQINGMFNGDRARKETLVEHGFRLPSALDNRPLRFREFEDRVNQVVFTSATPGSYEERKSAQVVEQIIRPTGLVDPELAIRPVSAGGKGYEGQVYDLIEEIKGPVKRNERVLVTTLTKKMAENLSEFLNEAGIKNKYLHSEIHALERVKILEGLRRGDFDVLVGVNLLREGLDLPEVSLVAILDADKEGFLRSETSLIQTIGRAARHIRGKVILYADNMTGSMRRAIRETERRRKKQIAYNKKHHITPRSVEKAIRSIVNYEADEAEPVEEYIEFERLEDIPRAIKMKEKEMKEYASNLEFERAAMVRDEIKELRKLI